MPNMPKELEPIIRQIIEDQAKNSKQKTDPELRSIIYKEIVKQCGAAGIGEDEFPFEYYLQLADATRKIIQRVQSLAKAYPPTHRHGIGEDGGVLQITQDPWMWYHDGTANAHGGSEPGDEDLPEEQEPGGGWAPQGEQDRAKAMLRQVADEKGFGEGDNPLDFVREVARRLGGNWGLNGKRGDVNNPSGDVLAWNIPGHVPQLFDVLYDSGGRNGLVWQPLRYGPGAVWIAP